MKEITIKLYEFNELSAEDKEKVIQNYYDINVHYDWWGSTYEDAENIGLKITSFDTDRGQIDGEFNLSANEVAQNILNNHRYICGTSKTAEEFMAAWQPTFNEYMNENSEHYESRESEEKLQDIENEFLRSLLEDYLIILRQEYEYLTSKEAIEESLVANEYTFEEGTLKIRNV